MAMLLNAQNISKRYGTENLFTCLSLRIQDDERVGVIGPNGAGKSTLFKIFAGEEVQDEGTVEIARHAHVAYLPQEDFFLPDLTLEEALIAALSDTPLDEHERTTRARVLLGRLGFADGKVAVNTLSGGWRKRLAIGRQIIKEPTLLLMDEPTNHLDMSGILWLEELLSKAPFAYVVISHDRVFLENVTNRMLEVSPRYPDGIFSVPGCYSDFLEAREALLTAQHRQEQSLAGVVRREIDWLRRGPKARTTKAEYRIKDAKQKIGDLAELKKRNALSDRVEIGFASTGRRTRDLLVAKDVAKAMGGTPLFRELDFTLSPGTRLGIVGNNGTGKSTMIRILTGELAPDTGSIKMAPELKMALFDQKREQLDRSQSLRRALAPNGDMVDLGERKMHVVGFAARFLFTADQLDTPVGALSGGEQARVLIASMVRNPVDILFLDEPTNDLDIPSIEILEESLQDFPGAVVLITHDRYMLERLCEEIVGLHGNGGCGKYTDLLQWERGEELAHPVVKREAPRAAAEKLKKHDRSGDRNLSREEQKELMRMEKSIQTAEEELASLQAKLANPSVADDAKALHDLCAKIHRAQTGVDTLYRRWEELEALKAGTAN